MPNIIDISGKTFGELSVTKKIGYIHDKTLYWECKCSCGRVVKVNGHSLRHGIATHCGCKTGENISKGKSGKTRTSPGESARNYRFYSYKTGAKNRGLEFALSFEQFDAISQQNCYYCGSPPSNISLKKEKRLRSKHGKPYQFNGTWLYNGIDRVDNSKGYVEGNCVPCCKLCNFAKRDLTELEFLDWIKRVYEFRLLT